MKPRNWDTLSVLEKKKVVTDLLVSLRGSYIISQALYIAIETMNKVPKQKREVSNIQDMEILLETVFPIYSSVVMRCLKCNLPMERA